MSQFLDELARTLARPMPRRRAMRLLGGALVGMAFPAATARAASATHDCAAQNAFLCACPNLDLFYKTCCPNETPEAKYECKCKAPPNGYAQCRKIKCPVPCRNKCCKPGEFCANPSQELCCKKNETGCGNRCCAPNEECISIRTGTSSERLCVARCPQGRARCGSSKCCPTNWRCANPSTGLCKRCASNEEECDTKCCNRQTTRCCGKAGCCPKNRSCCVTGKTQKCCPAGQKCAVPILAGDIGIKPGTASICCPPARYHESPKLCCPPGQVALQRPGQQVGPGLSPYCCPRAQICGSTCCQRSDVLGSQTCCNGKCVDTQFDPDNCGRCGNVCDSRVCSRGVCAFA